MLKLKPRTSRNQRAYPRRYERLVPVALVVGALVVVALLVVIVLVITGALPNIGQ